MLKSDPILVQHTRPTADDLCLSRLIEFMGLDCRTTDTSHLGTELERAADHDLCIMANAKTLDRLRRHDANAFSTLRQKARFFFVYGFAPQMCPGQLAAALSNGEINDVRSVSSADLPYEVSSSRPEITREFSGLSFGRARSTSDFGFVCSGNARAAVPLITIGGMPFWVAVEAKGCTAFLLACSAIADIQQQVNDIDPLNYFSRLLPAAMFLRSAFGSQCWHSKHPFASFIIDDPPLKRSYGYLNYRDLVSKMDRCNFATTIAFIPWNYSRTDEEVTQLFRERPDRLSLCIHGCDHSAGEFSSTDLAMLNAKLQLASARMNSLRRQSGLLYSNTMVFPQGRFSGEALTSLKANNYLAAVNSTAAAESSAAREPLALADFLRPAITTYGGFPLFLRHYPGPLEQFAFDLFFGKPLLVVEHHAYLKDGGTRLAEFMSRINSLSRLQWTGLHPILTRSHQERERSSEITDCRMNGNEHVIENDTERDQTFIFTKFEPAGVPVEEVLVNGATMKFALENSVLTFATRIPALSSARVNIIYRNLLPCAKPEQGIASRSRLWTRRMASEFRDNVLSRSDLLLTGVQALHRGLFQRNSTRTTRQNRLSSQ